MDSKITIELPEKHQQRLEEVASVEPTVHDQIETIVLPQVLQLINDAYRQLDDDGAAAVEITDE